MDRDGQNIVAQYFTLSDELTPSLIVKGKTAEQIYLLIIESGLVSKI